MKKIIALVLILVMSISLFGCAAFQASVAESMEEAMGVDNYTYEEYEAIYQAQWDEFFASFAELFDLLAAEAEEAIKEEVDNLGEDIKGELENIGDDIKDGVDDFVDDMLSDVEGQVSDKINDRRDSYGTRYEGSGQCKGFAKKVFKDIFGKDSVVPATSDNNYEFDETADDSVDRVAALRNMQNMSDEEIKEELSDVRPGDLIQMKRSHGGPHTAVVVSVTDEGMTWIEANLDGNNGIVVQEYTWAQLRDGKNGYRINTDMTAYTATDYSLDE